MSPLHIIVTILITAVWGGNFIFVKLGLHDIPPLLLCSLRFILSSIPAVFFFKKPNAPFKLIALYGMFTFAIQFALLFVGIKENMPPGLASMVLQMQVFFSLILAAIFLNERINFLQIIGGIIAFSGIGLVWIKLGGSASMAGFTLVLTAALSWGTGNLITKKIGQVNMLALVAWGSLVAAPILIILSLVQEGPKLITYSLTHMSFVSFISVLFITYGSTWFGYGVWGWLLNRYKISTVAPFSLLVPVFGLMSSNIVFNEPLQGWKLSAGGLILLGMGLHIFGPKIILRYKRNKSDIPAILDVGTE